MKMKVYTIVFMVTTSMLALASAPTLASNEISSAKGEIEDTVKEAHKAFEDFTKTLDSTEYLKYYASDYSGTNNGKTETRKDLVKMANKLAEQIKLRDPGQVSVKITDFNIHPITEHVAWLTYQTETKLEGGGTFIGASSECSTLVRKEGGTWLIFHEHCSTINEPHLITK